MSIRELTPSAQDRLFPVQIYTSPKQRRGLADQVIWLQWYQEYLMSEWWQTFRRYALMALGGYCAACGRTDHLNVHHRHYETKGRERLEDVMILCRWCHAAQHGKAA